MSLGSSMFSLFALMNGDMVFDTVQDLDTIDIIFSQLYLYIFISVSIMVIHNVFIVIIEDGYLMSKYRNRNDWLKFNAPEQQQTIIDHQKSHLQPVLNSQSFYSAGEQKVEPSSENPFAKIYRRKRKDLKSREMLVKMLWHDKLKHNLSEFKKEDEGDEPDMLRDLNRTSISDLSIKKESSQFHFLPTFKSVSSEHLNKMEELLASFMTEFQSILITADQETPQEEIKEKYLQIVTKMKEMLNE
jgi:hypothetical protein